MRVEGWKRDNRDRQREREKGRRRETEKERRGGERQRAASLEEW